MTEAHQLRFTGWRTATRAEVECECGRRVLIWLPDEDERPEAVGQQLIGLRCPVPEMHRLLLWMLARELGL